VAPPCPPACPEVFNAQCIVYTGTDIICNQDTVIKRYDYLDTIITKLVNYICNVQAPVTVVEGSTYIDVNSTTVGNTTTYTVSVDVAQLDVYFATAFQNDLFASIAAGQGIAVAANPITGVVTISHDDTSSVSDLNSDNSGNTFIQDIAFAFDTFGHVTGASVVAVSVTPQNTFDRATINPDSGFTWGSDNNPSDVQISESPTDALNFVAGTGIVLNASTVPGTDAIRITNSEPDQVVSLTAGADVSITGTYPNFTITNTAPNELVTLNDAGTGIHASLVNDGTGPILAIKGLQAGNGIIFGGNINDVIINALVNRDDVSVIAQAITATVPVVGLTHLLGTQFVSLTIIDTATNIDVTGQFQITLTGLNTYDLVSPTFTGTVRVLAIG
jgi:hypothetical protein